MRILNNFDAVSDERRRNIEVLDRLVAERELCP